MITPSRLLAAGSLVLFAGCTVSHLNQTDAGGGGMFNSDSSTGSGDRDTDSRTGGDKPAAVPPRPYRYYPSVFVYFDAERSLYFFPANKKWKTATEIPESFALETRKFVTLELATEKPFTLNKEHRKAYPPPKAKPKKKVVKKAATVPAPVTTTETSGSEPSAATATEPTAATPTAAQPAAAPAPATTPPPAAQ